VQVRYYSPNGRVHVRHGWSDRSDLKINTRVASNNVIAISGPPGVGKSFFIARLLRHNDNRFVLANKDSVRPPTKLEARGKIPYRQVSIWDIVNCKEQQLCSMNVGIYLKPRPEWSYWIKKMGLMDKGIFIPDPEETVTCADMFINRYLIKPLLKQHSRLGKNQFLLLEISDELENDFLEIFPEMTILRLQCKREIRVERLIKRYHPKTHRDWVIASLKTLESVSFRSKRSLSKNLYEEKNETREDLQKLSALVQKIVSLRTRQCTMDLLVKDSTIQEKTHGRMGRKP